MVALIAATSEKTDAKIATAILLAAGGAIITGLVAILNRSLDNRRKDRDRRRELYADAYRDCLAWKEGYFRVLRRQGDAASDRDLINRFHDLQEALDFHEGWINSESLSMGRAFSQFKVGIKSACEVPLQKAWDSDPVPQGSNFPVDAPRPDTDDIACRFQRDTRQHLAASFGPRLCVWWRYRPERSDQKKKEKKGAGEKK